MEERYSARGFLVWGISALFFLYEFMLRVVVGTFQHPIMYDLELSTLKFSLLSSTMYLVMYGLMQVPVGIIVDNFGLKKTLAFASFVCAGSVIGFGFAGDFYSAVIFRMLTGFGSSFGFICLLVAVYDWMPKRNIALMIGLSQFVGTMGPMLATGPMETVAAGGVISWRYVFIGLGVVGVLIGLLVLFFVENNRGSVGYFKILYKPESIKERMRRLFSRFQPWMVAIFSALVYFTIEYLSENEGKLFVMLKGHSSEFASYLLTLAWLTYAIGCPLYGVLSDHYERRKPFMVSAGIFTTLSVIGLVFFSNKIVLLVSFMLLGLGASGQSLGFVNIAELYKARYIPLALSLNNAMITGFASINAPLMGGMIDYLRGTAAPDLGDYRIAFYYLVGFVFLSIILPLFFIKETYGKSKAEMRILNVQR